MQRGGTNKIKGSEKITQVDFNSFAKKLKPFEVYHFIYATDFPHGSPLAGTGSKAAQLSKLN